MENLEGISLRLMGTGCSRWQINLVMHESFRIMKLIPTLLFSYYALEAVHTSSL